MNRYILPLLFILVSFGIYVTYIDKTYAEIQEQIKRQHELEAYLEQAANAQAELAEFASRVASFPAGAHESLVKMVPDEIDKVRFIVDVNALANQYGFKVKSPQVTEEALDGSDAKYNRHTLTFGISAPYPIFRNFLSALESSLALRDLSSVSFSAVPPTKQTAALISNPQFVVYDYRVAIISYSMRP